MTKEEKQESSQTLDIKTEADSTSFVDVVNIMIFKVSES